jgi:type III pantothenate kinase
MNTTLCFDFGNTRMKCAVFAGKEIIATEELTDSTPSSVQFLLDKYEPQASIISSVIDHDAAVEDLLRQKTKFHKLDHTSKYPITTPVGKPETIGADRLALCVAAVSLHPEQHNLVIALGSCITFNFINKFGEFLGGSISPGMEMRFKAMNQFTAKLPLVEASADFPLVGYDTRTNMLSGVILGMAKEIDGIIDLYCAKYANFNVLLTGGDMGFFAPHLKNKIFAHPNLIFNGLYAISEFNNV